MRTKMSDKWEKVEIAPAFKFENEGDEIEGVLVDVEENVGDNNSMLYTLKTKKGREGVWGSTVLDIRMKGIEKGEQVKIVFLGKEESKKRKGASYKNFDIFHKPGEVQVDEMDEIFGDVTK